MCVYISESVFQGACKESSEHCSSILMCACASHSPSAKIDARARLVRALNFFHKNELFAGTRRACAIARAREETRYIVQGHGDALAF